MWKTQQAHPSEGVSSDNLFRRRAGGGGRRGEAGSVMPVPLRPSQPTTHSTAEPGSCPMPRNPGVTCRFGFSSHPVAMQLCVPTPPQAMESLEQKPTEVHFEAFQIPFRLDLSKNCTLHLTLLFSPNFICRPIPNRTVDHIRQSMARGSFSAKCHVTERCAILTPNRCSVVLCVVSLSQTLHDWAAMPSGIFSNALFDNFGQSSPHAIHFSIFRTRFCVPDLESMLSSATLFLNGRRSVHSYTGVCACCSCGVSQGVCFTPLGFPNLFLVNLCFCYLLFSKFKSITGFQPKACQFSPRAFCCPEASRVPHITPLCPRILPDPSPTPSWHVAIPSSPQRCMRLPSPDEHPCDASEVSVCLKPSRFPPTR